MDELLFSMSPLGAQGSTALHLTYFHDNPLALDMIVRHLHGIYCIPGFDPTYRRFSQERLQGVSDPSFRALSGMLKFTARRHNFNNDSLFSDGGQVRRPGAQVTESASDAWQISSSSMVRRETRRCTSRASTTISLPWK